MDRYVDVPEIHEWKEVEGHEEYFISNLGHVMKNDLLLKQDINSGYNRITLWKEGTRKNIYVHHLVAKAFIPNPNNYKYVKHRNGDKLNNEIDNLYWSDKHK